MTRPRIQLTQLVKLPGLRWTVAQQADLARRLLPAGLLVQVCVTTDAEIRVLNRRFRQIDRVTDVLSFPYHQGEQLIGGDVFLAAGRVQRQAVARGLSVTQEFVRLVVHGLLHVVGHDHYTHDEFIAMRSQEIATLLEL